MNIHFILVEPIVPQNVGASARAINTMGFSLLRLVNPCDYQNKEARMLAYGSEHILEHAQVYPSLSQAIEDLDFVIGTSAKQRTVKHDYYESSRLAEYILNKKGSVLQVGLVFGSEERGLSTKELKLCDIVSGIRMHKPYPSLNLSAAVMIYSYCLRGINLLPKEQSIPAFDAEQYKAVKSRIQQLFALVQLNQESSIYHRIMERIGSCTTSDIRLIHSACRAVYNFLEKTIRSKDV